MATFYNNSPEKPERSNGEIYFKFIIFGILGGAAFIFLGLSIKFIIQQAIKYWIWVLCIGAGLIFAKKFLFKPKKKRIQQPAPEEYYE